MRHSLARLLVVMRGVFVGLLRRTQNTSQTVLALSRRSIIAYSWWAWVFQAPLIAWVVCWFLFTPSPGFAVAVLAFAAGVMAIRTEHFTRTEKDVWILIVGALCIVELRAISKDRDEHDKLQAEINEANDRNQRLGQRAFNDLLKQGSGLLTQERQLFALTLKNGMLATESLARMTGGDSYVYIGPGELWDEGAFKVYILALKFVGKYPLNDVHVTVSGTNGMDFDHDYGLVGPSELEQGKHRAFPSFWMRPGRDAETFTANINASNGAISQIIQCRKISGVWFMATRVWRSHAKPPNEILQTYIEPGYPIDAKGEVDWNSYK